jgi:hypothetical protein
MFGPGEPTPKAALAARARAIHRATPELGARGQHAVLDRSRGTGRRAVRPRRAILQPGQALVVVSAQPLVHCGPGDPELLGVPRSVKRGHIMQDVVVMGVAAAPGLGTASASVWMILGAIALAGAGGGIINALLSDNGDIEAYSREGVEV